MGAQARLLGLLLLGCLLLLLLLLVLLSNATELVLDHPGFSETFDLLDSM